MLTFAIFVLAACETPCLADGVAGEAVLPGLLPAPPAASDQAQFNL